MAIFSYLFINKYNLICSRSETSKVPASQMAPQAVTPAPPVQSTTSWASLFASSESQKKPVAKVSPYNSSQEPKLNNPPVRTTQQSTSNAQGKIIF